MGNSGSSSRPRPPAQQPSQQHGGQPHQPHQPHQQQQQQPFQQHPQQQAYGYQPSAVYQQHPPPPPQQQHFTNGQYYGGYHPAYASMVPPQVAPMPGHYGQLPPLRPPPPTHQYQQTQTIKNQVNLRKKTLRLEADPANPNRLILHFAFDASAPCRVTTFLLATEDPAQGCRIIGAVPEPRMPAVYDKGMDCRFPPDEAAAAQHAIDLGRHSTGLLTLASGHSYPLVIRLEALTDAAAAEGRTLGQLEVGGALPPWAQAQSTYAKLVRADEGHWGLQILKQKIWVSGVSYELQEIYGMEASRAAGVAAGTPVGGGAGSASGGGGGGEDTEGRECVICMSAPRDTTVLPCRHMCMCQACAAALRTQTNKCPICREPMESLLHIKLQGAA